MRSRYGKPKVKESYVQKHFLCLIQKQNKEMCKKYIQKKRRNEYVKIP